MVKLARQHGVEELLPFTVKGTEERVRRRAENGLRVKGTGVGQRVKGKAAERTMRERYVGMESWVTEMLTRWLQIGEAAAGDAGDAEDDPDVERGMCSAMGEGMDGC